MQLCQFQTVTRLPRHPYLLKSYDLTLENEGVGETQWDVHAEMHTRHYHVSCLDNQATARNTPLSYYKSVPKRNLNLANVPCREIEAKAFSAKNLRLKQLSHLPRSCGLRPQPETMATMQCYEHARKPVFPATQETTHHSEMFKHILLKNGASKKAARGEQEGTKSDTEVVTCLP